MSTVRQALAYTFSSQYLAMGMQFASTVIIARLLTPSEVGIFSVCAAFVILGHLLRDFGVGQYIVQEPELTTERIRSAFAVTLMLGWGVSAAVFALAPFASVFYDEPGIKSVLLVLGVNFALLPFSSITFAYQRREMNFRPGALAEVGSSAIQSIVSVTLAYMGYSYMSLAWGSLAGTVVTIAIVNCYRPKGLPMLPGLKEVSRVLGFGGKVSVNTFLAQLSLVIPDLILGKFHGFRSVGLYSRSVGTISLFGHLVAVGVGPVVGPAFADKKRGGHEIKTSYIFVTSCVTGLAWVFYANLAVLASPTVTALYGSQWTEIIPLVRIMCFGIMIYYFSSMIEQVFTHIGEVDRVFRYSIVFQPLRIIALGLAATQSLEAVVWVNVFVPLVRHCFWIRHAREVLRMELSDYLEIMWRSAIPAAASAGTSGLTMWLLIQLDLADPKLIVLMCLVTGGAVALVVGFKVSHPLCSEVKRFWDARRAQQSKTMRKHGD